MAIFTTRPALRWMVPAGVAIALLGGAVLRTPNASADPALPARSAAQLQTATVDGLSGTVVQRADLGLPSLPGIGGQGSVSLTSLLTGSHTLRVWFSGPDKARVALLGTLGETDVIVDGRNVWTWDSQRRSATHQVLAERATGSKTPKVPGPAASTLPKTPQEAADLALRAIDPTTVVSTAGSARVAGRSAYELALTPRDTASLVGQVRIALDARQHVPLRVQVYPHGSDAAALEVAFTEINFARPDAAQFRFNPPPGTTVNEGPTGDAETATTSQDAVSQPMVLGTGWTSVVVARLPEGTLTTATPTTDSKRSGDTASVTALLDRLPKASGAWGSGRLLSGRLFSVLITDDGRVLAGAVAPERLTSAAADPAAALKATR
jgi:outer membrane lipoprotein-sorting protein